MESLVFIGVLGVLGVIVMWYVGNEAASRDGETGLFALVADAAGEAAPGRRYRRKHRRVHASRAANLTPGTPAQTYRRKPQRRP